MKKNKNKEFIKEYGLICFIVFGPIIAFIIIFFLKDEVSKNSKQVHWHIPISYNLCGDNTQLKDSGKHGLLHGHNDGKIHLEGIIDTKKRAETLGGFFDTGNIIFSKTQIGKFKNGDICKGSDKPGKVSVLVNGKNISNPRDYILNNKDNIKILFK